MKTEKLYYKDAYIKDFTAEVVSVTEEGGRFAAVLDRTAFFPEEGGQRADEGEIGGVRVLNVKEVGGVVFHYLDKPITMGKHKCSLEFSGRFDKMQQHTAEHLASGIIHSLFGGENVGFHLGPDEVTFDTDIPLSEEMLDKVEAMANTAIYENRKVSAKIYALGEPIADEYRSKNEFEGDVRIVTIEGYDACACCAPHLQRTGEIGVLKFLKAEKHKGGMRIYMAAGERAYKYFSLLHKSAAGISAALSAPVGEIRGEVEKLIDAKSALGFEIASLNKKAAKILAAAVEKTEGNLTVAPDGITPENLKEFANAASERVGGILVALSGEEGNYKYVIISKDREVSAFIKEANTALGGRGGGRGEMAQGSFFAAFEKIKEYFDRL